MVTAATGTLPLGDDPPSHILQWKTQGDPADPDCFVSPTPNTCNSLAGAGGGSINDNDAITDFTDQTICTRIYFHASSQIVNRTGSSDNIKGVQLGRDNDGDDPDRPEPQATYEWQIDGGMTLKAAKKTAGVWQFDQTTSTRVVDDVDLLTDCRDNDSWCEIQVCHDHNWDATDHLRMRGRARSLGTGDITRSEQDSNTTDPNAQLSTTGRVMIWRFKIDQNTSGFVWVSHALIIRYPVDVNQWIPAATEIEGMAPPNTPDNTGGSITGGAISSIFKSPMLGSIAPWTTTNLGGLH